MPYDRDAVAEWLNAHQGKLVRRKNGSTIYIVKGFKMREGRLVLDLEHFRKHGDRTWAPLDTMHKFVYCSATGKEIHMHEDRCCCDAPEPNSVADLAHRFDAATLKKALKQRKEIDAARERSQAEVTAERAENQRLRQVAIKSLEKQAKTGDVAAAAELYRLAS